MVLDAEFMVDHGRDPGPDLDRAEALARAAMKKKAGIGYAWPILGQASLLRARWKVMQKQNPSLDLASARRHFEQGRRDKPNQLWPQKGLAACRLEELKARGAWDEGAYLRLLSEVEQLSLVHAKDPSLQALLTRVRDFGAVHSRVSRPAAAGGF
ncbi:MAG: hypothetical protein IPP78_02090 [Holophagaceae bacterium]|nr:hypothetical protein [Holophagaceae bacterium]